MKKRLTALLLSGVLAVSMFAGCSSELDKTAVVAAFGDTEVSLGLANFAARLQQAQYDDFYVAYFGNAVWSSDLYGNGQTMEANLKSGVMENLNAMYALKANMADYGVEITAEDTEAIHAAAEAFIKDNSPEAVEALGATVEIVEEYLELLTIQSRMYNEIIKDADTNVTDEEANMSGYSYIRVSNSTYTDEDGNSVNHTEETKKALKQKLNTLITDAKAVGLDTAAEEYDYTVTKGTFNAESTGIAEEVLTALASLNEGEISDLIETDSQYYVVRFDAETDEEATESNRQSIISERQSALYTEVTEGYMETLNWTVKEKVWAKVSFDNLFTLVEPTTETVSAEDTGIVSTESTEAE